MLPSQCLKKFFRMAGFMRSKNKVRHRILKRESQCLQFFLCPFSCLYDFITCLIKICFIFNCRHTCSNRCTVHSIRIKRILHIIQESDQFLISTRKTNSHPSHRTRLGKCLYDQKVIIFFNQWKRRLTTKIHISLVHDHNHIRIMADNILHFLQRHLHTCRRIRIREYNSSVFSEIIFRPYMKVLIQCRSLIWNAKQVCPYIIKRICDIRKKNRLL